MVQSDHIPCSDEGIGQLVGIQSFHVKGFRSLKDVEWRPGALNVLIGPNGAGKSNVLRFLELLVAASDGKLGQYVQMCGGMEAILWDGEVSSVDLKLVCDPVGMQDGPEVYSLVLDRLGKTNRFSVGSEALVNEANFSSGKQKQPFKMLERDKGRAVVFDEADHRLIPPDDSVHDEETLLSVAGVPFGSNKWIYQFRKYLSEISIYQDVHVNRDAAIRQPSVTRFEKRLATDGKNLVSVLHTLYTSDRDFKAQIDEGMHAAFGDEFEALTFPPAADQRIQLRIQWKGLRHPQSATDLSDGTLRFLLLMAILASPDRPSIIAVDEPEVGLHPAMFPIIAEYAVEASRHSQIIFTTHSPQFLNAFQGQTCTTSVVRWSNGETKIDILNPATLAYWLKEYSLGELFVSGELEDLV
ncbi:MAG: AAA family ATPase [Sulfobacillus sp.]